MGQGCTGTKGLRGWERVDMRLIWKSRGVVPLLDQKGGLDPPSCPGGVGGTPLLFHARTSNLAWKEGVGRNDNPGRQSTERVKTRTRPSPKRRSGGDSQVERAPLGVLQVPTALAPQPELATEGRPVELEIGGSGLPLGDAALIEPTAIGRKDKGKAGFASSQNHPRAEPLRKRSGESSQG